VKIVATALPGVLIFEPTVYKDDRGAFWETWNEKRMADAGFHEKFVQDNFSVSRKNVIRGIHYQVIQPQGKLVRVAYGAALDVAIDLRKSSPTFGKHIAVELTGENGHMLWIPIGFGHAFQALSETVGFAYKVTDYYSQPGERTLLWNDPALGIAWPIDPAAAIVSGKDQQGAPLASAEVFP
jgi:dTDP-4-dehydrorhamnose 3,5-epimerase